MIEKVHSIVLFGALAGLSAVFASVPFAVAQERCGDNGETSADCLPLRPSSAGNEPTSDLKTDSLTPARPAAAVKTDRGGATTGPERGSFLATRLIGQSVRDPDGEEVGQVTDLLLTDAVEGTAAVIRLGGVMGLATREVLVPVTALSMGRNEHGDLKLTSNWSKEQFGTAPVFDRSALMR